MTRIEAPTFNAVETYDDTYADESLPESVTSAVNDSLELILPAVTTAAPLVDTTEDLLTIAADTTSYADMTDALPDTIPETLAMPETITEMAAEIIPETVTETTTVKLPETAAETIIETQPETTPTPQDTNSLPSEVNSAPTAAGDRLVDKYNIEYDIVTPTVSVTDEEIQLTAAIIQLEVMGDGSKARAFRRHDAQILGDARGRDVRAESRRKPALPGYDQGSNSRFGDNRRSNLLPVLARYRA